MGQCLPVQPNQSNALNWREELKARDCTTLSVEGTPLQPPYKAAQKSSDISNAERASSHEVGGKNEDETKSKPASSNHAVVTQHAEADNVPESQPPSICILRTILEMLFQRFKREELSSSGEDSSPFPSVFTPCPPFRITYRKFSQYWQSEFGTSSSFPSMSYDSCLQANAVAVGSPVHRSQSDLGNPQETADNEMDPATLHATGNSNNNSSINNNSSGVLDTTRGSETLGGLRLHTVGLAESSTPTRRSESITSAPKSPLMMLFCEMIFRCLDVNGDGIITTEEYESVLQALSVGPPTSTELIRLTFRMLDAERDGSITVQSLAQQFLLVAHSNHLMVSMDQAEDLVRHTISMIPSCAHNTNHSAFSPPLNDSGSASANVITFERYQDLVLACPRIMDLWLGTAGMTYFIHNLAAGSPLGP